MDPFAPFKSAALRFHAFVDETRPELVLEGLPDYSFKYDTYAQYIRRVQTVERMFPNPELKSERIRRLMEKVRYVSAEELLANVSDLATILNRHRLVANKQYMVFIPDFNKSNLWITALFARFIRFDMVVTSNLCADFSVDVLESVVSKTKSMGNIDVLSFDDCIYSGEQATRNATVFAYGMEHQANLWYVAPIVHKKDMIDTLIYGPVREYVRNNSERSFPVDSERTMTYLQTKLPDLLSIFSLLYVGRNPFHDEERKSTYASMFTDDLFFINNCQGYFDDDHIHVSKCPPRAYNQYLSGVAKLGKCPLHDERFHTETATAGGKSARRRKKSKAKRSKSARKSRGRSKRSKKRTARK